MAEKTWSRYSIALYDRFANSEDNIIVYACPGAGKTTNIEHIWSLDDKATLYAVFNKHNQIEAQEKLPDKANSAVLTLNGLGHRIVMDTFGKVKLDKWKVSNIIKDMFKRRKGSQEVREQQYTLEKMVGIAKCVDTGKGFTHEMFEDTLSIHDSIEEYPGLYYDTVAVLERSDDDVKVIDFQDQLRFPVIYQCNYPEYHNVLGDEVQDFNPVQAAMLQRLGAKRYILVGDGHQSIYGFRGAMNNSMSVLKEQFHCTELPLSITYRCAKDVVKEAYNVYPDIEAWEESPQGIVRYAQEESVEHYSAQDIILCRMNRPLIALAYELLKSDTPCYVRGRDIGEGLVRLIRKQGCTSVRELITRLNEEYAVEAEKARVKGDEDKIQRIADRYGSALLFCSKASLQDDPETVCTAITRLFSEGKGVCLSTVHKAKGLEAQKAFLLDSHLYSSFAARARQAWQKEQERNILYVAITRAKGELVYM